MTVKLNSVLICFLFGLTSFTYAQKHVVYYFSEIGLTVQIPAEFAVLDVSKSDALNHKGLELIEDVNHTKIDISGTKTLIAARKSETDYFNITVTAFDPEKDGSIDEADAKVNDLLFQTF